MERHVTLHYISNISIQFWHEFLFSYLFPFLHCIFSPHKTSVPGNVPYSKSGVFTPKSRLTASSFAHLSPLNPGMSDSLVLVWETNGGSWCNHCFKSHRTKNAAKTAWWPTGSFHPLSSPPARFLTPFFHEMHFHSIFSQSVWPHLLVRWTKALKSSIF